MEILQALQNEQYFISENKDVVCTDNRVATIINIADYPDVVNSIDIDKQIISDCCFLDRNQFNKKYEGKLLQKAPLTLEKVYRMLRHIIVDEKLPISNKKQSAKKTVQVGMITLSGSRKDQIKQLLSQGIAKPSVIAKELGTNAGYVSRLIKEING